MAMQDYHQAVAAEEAERERMYAPWQLVWRGVNVHRRPTPLRIFVEGHRVGTSGVRVDAMHRPTFVSAELQNPHAVVFPAMDLVSFGGIIMSLLAIVFGYDAICGEKERGTLRLMLSYAVPRDRVLLGKWVGGYLALIIPFLLSVLSGGALLQLQPEIEFTPSEWTRLTVVAGLTLVYIAAVYSAAIWVSGLTRRGSTSIMVLLMLWMVVVLAVPNLAPHLAQAWRPTRDSHEMESARQLAVRQAREEFEQKRRNLSSQPGPWTDLQGRDRSLALRAGRLELQRDASLSAMQELSRLEENFRAELDEQIAISRWIARLSPFASYVMATAELADAGLLTQRHFRDRVRAYQEGVTEYAFDQWIEPLRVELETGERPPRGEDDEPVPSFTYQAPAGREYMRAVIVDAGLLMALTIAFFLMGYVTFLRYDVR